MGDLKINATIVDAAEQLLNSESGSDFTVDQLAEAAQMSRASVYRRIGSKEALLQHLAQRRGVPVEELGPRDVRNEILLAARMLFGRHGLGSVTMEQIAQEAGVGIATVYRQFGDKAGLLDAFSQTFRPRVLQPEALLGHSGSLRDDLLRVVESLLRFMQENGDLFRLILVEHSADLELVRAIQQTPNRTLFRLADFFQAQMAAGQLEPGDAQQMALALIGMTFGFGFIGSNLYDLPTPPLENTAQTIVSIFLQGVAKRN
ncbi:MAG: TetR/AcrR family transcriptional regulator [Caldilineaceae bacterium]